MELPAGGVIRSHVILRAQMPAIRTAFLVNTLAEFFLRRNVIFPIHSDIPDDLSTEQPELVHMLPDGLSFQAPGKQMHHEWAHRVKQTLSIGDVLISSVPTVRPLGKVGADIFGGLHIFWKLII
jgi:hypothetical protein